MLATTLTTALSLHAFDAQEPVAPASEEAVAAQPAPIAEETWSFSFALYTFDPPDEDAYATFIGYADLESLSIQARYQYEALDTVSLYFGHRLSWEGEVSTELVPMVGLVVGEVDGIAPGFTLDMTWKRLQWYVEAQYVFDFHDSDDNYAYTWSELTFGVTDWMRLGLVAQRTRIYDQELDVDRGLLLKLARERFAADVFWFNPDQDDPYFGFSFALGF
jgi:hypothetical protein